MATTIRIKKSGATGNVPANTTLEFGELALNYADGVLYFKNAANQIQQISGTTANTFETINANGSLLIADSNVDILSITAGSGIDISANTLQDTITIAARLDDTVTSTDTAKAATANSVKTAYDQATNAYNAANNAAVRVTANAGPTIAANTLSFNNTATVTVSVIQDGANANISFTAAPQTVVNDTFTAAGNTAAAATANIANGLYALVTTAYDAANVAANTVSISQNNQSTLNAKRLNFVNSSSVLVNVSDSGNGNANISFTSAASVSTSTIISDRFSGTGACTQFNMSNSGSTDATFVYIDGVSQKPAVDYQVSGSTLTFNTAPLGGTSIEVRSLRDIALINASTIKSQTFVGDASCTQFTLSGTYYSSNGMFVFVDGVTQVPTTDYSVYGSTLTFVNPPEANGVIEVRSIENIQVSSIQNTISDINTTLFVYESAYSFGANGFSTVNDSINRNYILRGITASNTETELFLSNGGRIPVSTNTTVFYSVDIVGRRTDATGESAGFHVKGVVDNFSNIVADVGDLYEVVVAEDDATLSVDARADDTNKSINIYVTGANGKTIRWTALVRTVEVAQ